MNIPQLLKEHHWLLETLRELGFSSDIPAITRMLGSGALLQPNNISFLERSCAKYASGEKFTSEDWDGITVDRRLLQVVLSAFFTRMIRVRHAELKLPAAVTAETSQAIGNELFEAFAGYPEPLWHKLGWTSRYYTATMFKTGIFVYNIEPTSEKLPVWAYRESVTGKVIALASDGLAVDEQGLICQKEMEPTWHTTLRHTSTTVSGNYIDPTGYITKRRVTLALEAWENILAPAKMTAAIHIPAGRAMISADCGASMRSVAQILRKYLPHLGVRCITCMSWVFSPDWLTLLPESNMAQVMREVYLFPIYSAPTAGINFVFRKPPEELDLQTAPRQTRLQRIMLERLEQKKPLYAGGMFMLLEDVDRYGSQHYHSASL